jgi:hypothetical protein
LCSGIRISYTPEINEAVIYREVKTCICPESYCRKKPIIWDSGMNSNTGDAASAPSLPLQETLGIENEGGI